MSYLQKWRSFEDFLMNGELFPKVLGSLIDFYIGLIAKWWALMVSATALEFFGGGLSSSNQTPVAIAGLQGFTTSFFAQNLRKTGSTQTPLFWGKVRKISQPTSNAGVELHQNFKWMVSCRKNSCQGGFGELQCKLIAKRTSKRFNALKRCVKTLVGCLVGNGRLWLYPFFPG